MENVIICLKGGLLDGQNKEVSREVLMQGIVSFWGKPGEESFVYACKKDTGIWHWIDTDLVPDVLPTVGRIVWYYVGTKHMNELDGLTYDEIYENGYLPAVVVEAFKDATVNLKVWAQNDFYVTGAPYNKKGVSGSWQWPIITPQQRTFSDLLK